LRKRGWPLAIAAPVATFLPAVLVTGTVKAAELALMDQSLSGVVSAQVVTLSERVVKAMFMKKLGAIGSAILILGTIGVGADRFGRVALADGPATAETKQAANPEDAVRQAAAELEKERNEYARAMAHMEMIKQRVARKEALYRIAVEQKEAFDRVDASARAVRFVQGLQRMEDKVSPAAQAIAARFKYRIPVEIGKTWFKDDVRLQIKEVWGTQPEIKIGGCYIVRATYSMPNYEKGKVYFYETATDAQNATSNNVDLQQDTVQGHEGEFALYHEMRFPGYFHVQLFGEAGGQSSKVADADVYFGTGSNVWREK
jgi:hypothetical protein